MHLWVCVTGDVDNERRPAPRRRWRSRAAEKANQGFGCGTADLAGLSGAAGLAGYCATKGAVRLFTKAAALEFAALGVRVNSVHPGVIDTPIWESISSGVENTAFQAPGANHVDLEAMTQMITPMGKPGFPHDIAEGVLFLASNESRYMTGSELVIDGGITAR